MNPKTRYDTIESSLMIERSKPLRYKIVRFVKPKFLSHKEFYMYHCIRVELFELATWKWKLLDEVKLPYEESLRRMTKVSVNGSLHGLTWKKDSDNKDMELVEYKGKLVMTYIDKESNLMELWIMKDHNRKQWSKRHSINIGVLTRKEPNVSPLAFYNVDVVLIKEYFF
uniref:F-box associated beta-propeller type 3 domain-containing protein n=1 Tax=Populus trichocarpa TaxID=3694 RepID=B9IE04_POPTR